MCGDTAERRFGPLPLRDDGGERDRHGSHGDHVGLEQEQRLVRRLPDERAEPSQRPPDRHA